MKRKEAIKCIVDDLEENDIIISSTGMISRELYEFKDRPLNFYMMGSMGNALSIGLGLALNNKDRKVIVLNGDGSALMSLGTMGTHNKLKPKNLYHFILDNNEHASTGGQTTSSNYINFEELAPNTYTLKVEKGKGDAKRIPLSCKQIKTRFYKALKNNATIDKPDVTLIMSTFNRKELLEFGLSSLAKQETNYKFEVMVINDGKRTDETKQICNKYSDKLNINYLFTGHRNKSEIKWRCPGFPLNIGVKKSKSKYIILTSPEIYHLDNRAIEKTMNQLTKRNKSIVIPNGYDDQKSHILDAIRDGRKLSMNFIINKTQELNTKMPFFFGLDKSHFIKIGGYDEDMIGWAYDDTDLTYRLLRYGCRFVKIDSKIIHLYHPRHRPGIGKYREMYKYNKEIYESKDRKGVIYSNIGKEWGVLNTDNIIKSTKQKTNGWYLNKIPKICYFYWGNDKLPYLRYLSILSFSKFNPDWKINVYVPFKKYKGKCFDTCDLFEFTGRDYYQNLRNLCKNNPNVEIIETDFNFIGLNIFSGNKLAKEYYSRQEVYKSDFLRWYLLSTIGGLWSDMDIMYFKPINNIKINRPENKEINTIVSLHPQYKHSVGFMLSSGKNNDYYTYVYNKSRRNFNPKYYQSVGVNLLNEEFPNIKEIEWKFPDSKGKVSDIGVEATYSYDALNIPIIYNSNNMSKYSSHSIGLHWYGGHKLAKVYLNKINHLNYRKFDNVIAKTVIEVYK